MLARIVELELSDMHDAAALSDAIDALTALYEHAAIATSVTKGIAVERISASCLSMHEILVTANDVM